jgi:hypothetical protein
VIIGVIALSIVASLVFPQGPHDPDEPPIPLPLGHEIVTHDRPHGEPKHTAAGDAREKKR